jgi:hypothetical protein
MHAVSVNPIRLVFFSRRTPCDLSIACLDQKRILHDVIVRTSQTLVITCLFYAEVT